jgi:hypothetical protein
MPVSDAPKDQEQGSTTSDANDGCDRAQHPYPGTVAHGAEEIIRVANAGQRDHRDAKQRAREVGHEGLGALEGSVRRKMHVNREDEKKSGNEQNRRRTDAIAPFLNGMLDGMIVWGLTPYVSHGIDRTKDTAGTIGEQLFPDESVGIAILPARRF